jgi:hypothetical protein
VGGSKLAFGAIPRYLRYNVWTDEHSSSLPSTAEWTETAEPLPPVPPHELNNPIAQKTISENPHLFSVTTPINVDVFERLLASHPNQPFVQSVCRGLREGFWPWADTHIGEYPTTHSEDRGPPTDEAKAAFLRAQRDIEIAKGRFSPSFGPTLLPGMYCMPIHAVPKPHSSDFRLVTDHSAGRFSLNSMVDTERIRGCPLDNMRHIGEHLLELRRTYDSRPLVMFKSDIAEAYRLIPMHPIWQLKQAVFVDGEGHIDRRNCFGNSASNRNFVSVNALVAWIVKYVKSILGIFTYVDDSSGAEFADQLSYYAPYRKLMPSKQVALLEVWDELGIPHVEKKQVFGSPLTIIGIDVDPNNMTLTLPADSRLSLLEELRFWGSKPTGRSNGAFKLKKWQVLAGWVNWALNVYPLLRPALNNVYPKIAGKLAPRERIWVNNAVREDFNWAADLIEHSSGVRLLKSTSWDPSLADVTIYCDACLDGLGFWFPDHRVGYYSPVPMNVPVDLIFFFEALSVTSAVHRAHLSSPNGSRIVVYTDNMNTVNIFNSLHCQPAYNRLLRFVVDILVQGDHDLRVLHVPGEENEVADAISRQAFGKAIDLVPGLQLLDFQPPPLALGAARK